MSFESELHEKADYWTENGVKRRLPMKQLLLFVTDRVTSWIEREYPDKIVDMDKVFGVASEESVNEYELEAQDVKS